MQNPLYVPALPALVSQIFVRHVQYYKLLLSILDFKTPFKYIPGNTFSLLRVHWLGKIAFAVIIELSSIKTLLLVFAVVIYKIFLDESDMLELAAITNLV